MIKREDGFSLVELMITMVVFVFVIAAASQVFTGLLTQFKQQSKIAETNIEGIVGLEILRQDIEHAGYGLPWNVTGVTDSDGDGNLWDELTNYNEASSATYNDGPNSPPRAIISGNNVGTNNSDYLVIKSANVARNDACQKFTFVNSNNQVREWKLPNGNFDNQNRLETNDRVIVISPSTGTNERLLVVKNNGTFYTTYQRGTNPGSLGDADFAPSAATEVNIVYGISPEQSSGDPPETITPRMPFNRADYYISTSSLPSRCAPNTGVLEKATVNHNGGGLSNLPLLDCVADMQVVFGVDTDATPDGQINCYYNNLSSAFVTINAQNIRERVKEVRIYILSQEGQIDRNFTINLTALNAGLNPAITGATYIRVGEGLPLPVCDGGGIAGQDFNLSPITDYLNYRWKVYTLVVKPNNLR